MGRASTFRQDELHAAHEFLSYYIKVRSDTLYDSGCFYAFLRACAVQSAGSVCVHVAAVRLRVRPLVYMIK